jgi:cold shock CspA family protein
MGANSNLTRVGVFYDGNFFFHVSNYYHYHHERRARISVSGLHEFIRHQVAESEGSDVKYCQIVDAHYFRGRRRAQDAEERGSLRRERVFDEVLMREGAVTHYLPLGPQGEKGIDVWLALKAYELAIYKRFDISALIVCDGDFLPLVRKLNTLGTRVMLLAWDFKWINHNNQECETRTAQVLLDEVTYPVMMHQIIDDRSRRNDRLINSIFVPHKELKETVPAAPAIAPPPVLGSADATQGKIKLVREGYGFIIPDGGGPDVFFYHTDLSDADFNELKPGQVVRFRRDKNDKGPCAREIQVAAEKTTA